MAEVKTPGATTHWLLPLAVLWEDQPSAALANMLAVARVRRGRALVCSRTPLRFRLLPIDLLAALLRAKNLRATTAYCAFSPLRAGRDQLDESLKAEVNLLAAEQSNSLLTIGDVAMLKMYRRISAGQHPEAEMNRYLTSQGLYARAGASRRRGACRGGRQPSQRWRSHWNSSAMKVTPGRGWWITSRVRSTREAPAEPVAGSGADLLADCDAIVAAIGRAPWRNACDIGARDDRIRVLRRKSLMTSDATGWAKKTGSNVFKKRSRPSLDLQTWQREQDRERAQELVEPGRRSIAAAVRTLAESGTGNADDPHSRRLSSGPGSGRQR